VKEADAVQAGQLLLRLEAARQTAEVARAEAGLKRAQAQLDLLNAGARPEDVAISQTAIEAAQAQLDKLSAGAKAEDVRAAEAGLAAARLRWPRSEGRTATSASRRPKRGRSAGPRPGSGSLRHDRAIPTRPSIRSRFNWSRQRRHSTPPRPGWTL
jgi:hypothetical protein